MPNSYFSFRHFTVWQDRCAMKVCTDASLFGAWLSAAVPDAVQALDIGTGTGLLSLMVAQRSGASIDAIEIDPDAAQQASENFQRSPWAARLTAIPTSIQDYARSPAATAGYDLIFSNPPFYTDNLRSFDSKRNLALHSDALSLEELMGCASTLLAPGGTFAVMIPWQRAAFIEKLASEHQLFIHRTTRVRQTAQHTFFRAMYFFCEVPQQQVYTSEIVIKDNNQQYTPEFSAMMQDHYLFRTMSRDE